MNHSVSVAFGGSSIVLHGSGAVYLPKKRLMLVADLHLGKAATYRRLGQPVPQGTTRETLKRISAAMAFFDCQQLLVLGDFLHAKSVHESTGTLTAIKTWRQDHADYNITLVRGNHDDRAGDPPDDWQVHTVDEPLLLENFAFLHHPPHAQDTQLDYFAFAGHVHPVAVLRGRARERLRLPCFVIKERLCQLPAFGAFTGGHVHRLQAGEALYVLAEGQVFEVTQTV
jgi:DNA ligase-associated metallophosphoesterase